MKKLVFAALLIPVMGHATTFSCKAIQEGHIDSGSQKVSVDSTFDIQDKKMTINLGGKTWRLDFVGQKASQRCMLHLTEGLQPHTLTMAVYRYLYYALLIPMGRWLFTH